MVERVLFVHAHPDDESIATGGTIATLIERGAIVTVLTCTRGERGEVIPDDLAQLRGDREAIAAERTAEIARAMAELGVTDHRFLGEANARWVDRAPRRYTDSGMRWGTTPTGIATAVAVSDSDPTSLTAADQGEVASDIAAVISAVSPHVVVSYDANGGYGHPDHIRTHHATRIAAEVLGVPFFEIQPADAAGAGIMSVDVRPVFDRKRAALAAYRTQMTVREHDFVTPGGAVEPIATVERFRRVRPPSSDFAQYSLASRIISCVFGLVIGAFAGATLTVAHQASVTIGSIVVPWGLIAAIAVTAALLVGLRLVFETRLVAGFAALGLLAAAALLAIQSAGGSILVPENLAGYVWTFAPVVIAGLVLAWPRVLPGRSGNIEVPAAKGPDLQ